MAVHSYKSNGIVSRSITDYRDYTLSDFSNRQIWEGDEEFTEKHYQSQRISDVNYGTISDFGSYGMGCAQKGSSTYPADNQFAQKSLLIVGEKGNSILSGSAVTYVNQVSGTSIICTGGICVYSYEAGNVSETVGQYGPSVISTIGARRISSFQFVFDVWQPISRFVGAAEASVKVYKPCITEPYSELDYGLITANHTATIDNGLVSHADAVTLEDRGNILDRALTRFGFVRKIGEAQAAATNAWIGSGRLVSFGRQVSPAIYGYIVDGKVRSFYLSGTGGESIPRFWSSEGGTLHVNGNSTPSRTILIKGDGSLRKFGGTAESATWNPEEKQMLFSFTGGLTSEKHVESYVGSGRIRNLAKIEAEEKSFTYTGSGLIHLKPRKPVTYELSELANFTLVPEIPLTQEHENFGDNTYWWQGTTQLGNVKLKDLAEKDHEKHTQVYTETALVSYSEIDYGYLINQNVSNCVAASGIISTNTTATTGCTQVAPGTTLAVAPVNTYTIPPIQTSPTSTIDYGNVTDDAPPSIDHGWILGERSDLRRPYGRGLRFTSQVEVNVNHVYHWTSTGEATAGPLFRFIGDTALPLDVSEYGEGTLFTMGGAAETFSFALDATGLFRFLSLTHVSRARDYTGSGRIPVFKGAAESLTWNPTEEQILFSVHGISTEKHTEVFRGSGSIRKLSGAAESIRWAAQHTTGLYKISGDSYDTRARAFAGFGTLRKFTGTAESLTWNPEEKQMLFSFTGGITSEKHTESYVGSGRIRNLATLEAERQSFDWVGSGTINLLPRKPECYELSELANFTLDNYILTSGYIDIGYVDFYTGYTNLAATQLKWLVCEQGHEKNTDAYNNSACEDGLELDYGNLVNQNLTNCVANSGTISTNTVATNGCIKVAPSTTLAIAPGSTYTIPNQLTTPSDSEDYGLVSNPNAPVRDYGWILGSLSKVCPFGAFEITGSAKTHFVENIVSTGISYSGRASLNIFGDAATFWTPPYHGDGLYRIGGIVGESWTPWIPPGSGLLFSMGGAVEATTKIEKADGLFRISGDAFILFSLQHFGSGTIRVLGTGGESITPATYVGSGSFKKFSGAAESLTYNPEERQLLFSFTGEHTVKFVADPPEEGTEIRLRGTTQPEILTFAEQPFGRIPVSGVGGTDRTRVFVGSGSLRKFQGAAESLTYNPEEKQMLFSFAGSGTERVTLNPPEEGTDIRLRGEAVAIWEASYIGSGQIPISGDALTPWSRPYIGYGTLKKFSGAAESLTYNPEERQLLFSFTGTGSEFTVVAPPEGEGILFTFSGATATSAAVYETSGLFKIGGIASTTSGRDFIGSGSFKKFSGASESLTYNPDEKQLLFSFAGTASESTVSIPPEGTGRIAIYPEAADYRFTPNWNSVGGVRIEIQSAYRFAPVWIGSGSLRKFSGAAESLTFNPEEKQMLFSFAGESASSKTSKEISKGGVLKLDGSSLVRWVPNNIGSGTIRISGDAKTHWTPHVIGSGVLYTFQGAAESKSVDITSLPSLFRVYGDSGISRSRPYIGFGSLKKFQGAAESLTFNPDEKQMLFNIMGYGSITRTRSEFGQGTIRVLGEADVRFSPVYNGSGTTRLSGEASVTSARDFVGSGSFKKFSGAAESLTWNPEEKQMLFNFLGEGSDSTTTKLLSQGGVLTTRGTSGDPLITYAEEGQGQLDTTGEVHVLRTFGYAGSGRISNVNNLDEAFAPTTYVGSGRIRPLTGAAIVQIVVWQPPHSQVWII